MNKPKLMVLLLIVVFFMCFARPPLAEEGFKVQYTAKFSQDVLSFDKLMGYDLIKMKDGNGGWLAELAKPMLPTKEVKIALPAGMAAKNVSVVDAKSEEILGVYNIFPSQPPLKTGSSGGDADFLQPDNQTYASSQPYPARLVKFIRQADLAGQSIAVIQLYPLQYIPAEKRLILYTSITLAIEGVGGYQCGDYLSPNISQKDRREYEQRIKEMVQNPQDVQLNTALKMSTSMLPPGGPFAHVIVTSTTYASYFQPLADWHTQKGVKDTIITTAWIYANYTGADSQKIRAFVIDAYSTWGTTYFLMGGERETVPFVYRTYYQESTPSDQYYSDFDDDWIHDVYVGRASAGSSSEITTFVNKVLKYEKDPPRTNYPLDVLLIGMDTDEDTHNEYLKQHIDAWIPAPFNVSKVYDSQITDHKTAALNALNAGQNLVNHADHSNYTVMGTGDYWHGLGISNSDVDNLTNNNQTSIIVSLGCDPNGMDYNDCIAEHFVIYNPNQAGVAFIGNTRSGWFYSGFPDELSGQLDKQWWIGLFSRNTYNLGQTLVDSKHNFGTGEDPCSEHCEWTFNLLGEPEMPIWTDSPDSFTVTHLFTIRPEPSSFLVNVKDATSHAPVELAYACLWKGSEVYLTGYTNASGDVTFNPSPSTIGVMYVTITKHNYIPYQKQVDVSTYLGGDPNGDWQVNSSDIVYLINYLYVGGPAPIPWQAGDPNGDCAINSADVTYLINYLYIGGPRPVIRICPK